jgi:uncharacterized protein
LLLWNGDVLHIYAILGVPLLLLRKLPDKWLWAIVALLVLAPGIRTGVAALRHEKDPYDKAYWLERGENQLRVFGNGPYSGTVTERFRETRQAYLENGDAWFWTIMATTLTIGFIVGRRRIFQNLPQYVPRIRRFAWWAGGLGFALSAAFATCSMLADHGSQEVTLLEFLGGFLYILNRPILCAFYIAVIVLLADQPRYRAWMNPLASVGRMPLTNYLMQSVIASTIFYGYGFGFYHKIGPAAGVLIAFAIYGFQVVYSNFWMARFRFGPMEWLWRFLTYGKAPAMRARTSQIVAV